MVSLPFCFVLQFIRFLRRTEGIEAARKYFLEVRKLPSCTYHVYVAYATMSFCLDKDAKVVKVMTCMQTFFPLRTASYLSAVLYLFDYSTKSIICKSRFNRIQGIALSSNVTGYPISVHKSPSLCTVSFHL